MLEGSNPSQDGGRKIELQLAGSKLDGMAGVFNGTVKEKTMAAETVYEKFERNADGIYPTVQ